MSIDHELPRIQQPAPQVFAEANAPGQSDQDPSDPPTLTDLPVVPGELSAAEPAEGFSPAAASEYGTETESGWRPATRADLQRAALDRSHRPSSVRHALSLDAPQPPRNSRPQHTDGEGWPRSRKIVAAGLGVAGAAALAVGVSMLGSSSAEHPSVPIAASSPSTPGAGTSELASPTTSPSPLPSPSLFGLELTPVPTTPASDALKPVQLMENSEDDPCIDLDVIQVAWAINDATSQLAQGTCNETPTADTYFSDTFTAPGGTQVTLRIMDDAALGAESQVITAADGTKKLKGPGNFGQLSEVYGDNYQYSQQGVIQAAGITTYGEGAHQYEYSAFQLNQGATHEVVAYMKDGSNGDGRDFVLTFTDPRESGYSLQDPSPSGESTVGSQVANLVSDLDAPVAQYNEVPGQ